jgi:hypothetical protein
MAHVATVTIDSDQVFADATNFPAYINLAHLFAGSASFASTVANGGGDIRVFQGASELAREVVSCRPGTFFDFSGSSLPTGFSNTTDTWLAASDYIRPGGSTGRNIFADFGAADGTAIGIVNNTTALAGHYGGLLFRQYDADNYWVTDIDFNAGSLRLYKRVAGSATVVDTASVSVSLNTEHEVKVLFSGNDITVYLDGVAKITATDSFNASATTHGLRGNQTGLRFYEFHFIAEQETTGTGELHVLIPFLDSSQDTVLSIYADGSSADYAVDDPFGRNAVWGDYAFVLRTESDATDSTGNLSVTEEGTPSYTAGKLGGGAALTNAGFNFSNDTSPYSLGSGYWLSWWGDFNNFSPWANLIRFASTSSGGATGAISLGRAGTTSNLYLQHDTTSVGNVFSGGVSNFIASEEHYYGLRWDGSTAGLYRDATENYSRSEAVAPDMSHANFNRMFWETSSTNSDWNYVDEIRIRNGDPGANWITTEYNNQSDPSSFYTATDPNAGGGVSVAVPAASVTITGYAPTVTGAASISVDVPAGEISVTGYAPTVTSTDNVEVAIPADSLTVTGYAPTVTASDSQEVSPGADSISVTGYAPTIAITDAQAIVIPAGSVTVTGYAPSVETTSNVTVEVDTGSVSITGHAPAVGTSISVSPAVSTLSITGYAPAVVASVKTVTCTLVDVNGRALPNLSDLSYAWFDEPDPANLSTPVVKGVTESTDGSGVIEVPISGSSLTSGQTGLLVLRSSDGESLGAYNLPVA